MKDNRINTPKIHKLIGKKVRIKDNAGAHYLNKNTVYTVDNYIKNETTGNIILTLTGQGLSRYTWHCNEGCFEPAFVEDIVEKEIEENNTIVDHKRKVFIIVDYYIPRSNPNDHYHLIKYHKDGSRAIMQHLVTGIKYAIPINNIKEIHDHKDIRTHKTILRT